MTAAGATKKIRVLVVEDSAYNRQAIIDMIESDPLLEVAGLAANGEDGLKEALRLKPDVITLDLEMPRMDGFTFLRILMSRLPTAVIVVSSYSRKQNVFKALELGALDFIAKPARYLSPELHAIRDELVEKVKLVRFLHRGAVAAAKAAPAVVEGPAPVPVAVAEPLVVAIGASTGGPPALQRLLARLPGNLPASYLVAQHMPQGFTRAFADRLNRYTNLRVVEAQGGEELQSGHVFISPGGSHLEVGRSGNRLHTVVKEAREGAKYVPSIDSLFASGAKEAGKRCCAVLLTGMGSDGKVGMQAVKAAGGRTVAESEDTAVIFGMPKEAIDSGCVDAVCRLDDIAGEIMRFVDGFAERA